ncbi:TPA: DUF3325 family protein [Pseudomonas aeruginosa]|nr:DUF3325 family protein [Pseudomonas aeruginosa]
MNLRQSMSGLHTWSGLLVSWLLFVIVFAGSLASFDKELTRWMQPDLHLPGAQSLGADQVRDWLRQRAPDAHAWWMLPPSERAPYWNAGWEPRDGSEFKVFQLDAVSGQPLPKTVGHEPSASRVLLLRGVALLDLGLALAFSIHRQGVEIGIVFWSCLLMLAAATLVLLLAWRPRWALPCAAGVPLLGGVLALLR